MTHGSLFSGIGGFDLVAEWVGWENVFNCEIEEFPRKILNYYWPKSISYEDIKRTDFTIHRGRIDVLTGGFPCQPFSQAGKRKGTEDNRYLWPEFIRAIREIKPAYVVGENVYGLINWSGGLVFDQVQIDLENEGYEVAPVILPACGKNAPHKRNRIWFVAYNNKRNWKKNRLQARGEKYLDKDRRDRATTNSESTNDGRIIRGKKEGQAQEPRISTEPTTTPNANSKGLEGRGGSLSGSGEGAAPESGAEGGEGRGTAVADTDSERFRIGEEGYARPWIYPEGERDYPSARRTSLRVGTHWITDPANGPEPLMGRVAHGIPKRVDRLRGLGNSVVPQLFEWIGDLINDHNA